MRRGIIRCLGSGRTEIVALRRSSKADLPLEPAHPCLARVLGDVRLERGVGEGDLPRRLAAVHPTRKVPHVAELAVGAAVIAAVFLGQVPPLAALPAALLLLLGLGIVVSGRPPDVEPAIPAE